MLQSLSSCISHLPCVALHFLPSFMAGGGLFLALPSHSTFTYDSHTRVLSPVTLLRYFTTSPEP